MSDPVKNTFGHLRHSLESLGFHLTERGGNLVFTHPSGQPLILLPAYKNNQAVKPIHLMMVKKQLADAGMIEPGSRTIEPLAKPVPQKPTRPKSHPKLKA